MPAQVIPVTELEIPMFAEDEEALQEIRKKRNQYWSMLRRAKADFIKLTDQACIEYEMGDDAFYYYLRQNYGLQVELIDGKIAGDYVIVDEKKYLLFLLKFGQ
jgi:hypothetical protein